MEEKVISIKGFDKNLQCRGYQFELGKTYTHGSVVKVCDSGFHAVEYGIDAFSYYAPADSRYCVVEQYGDMERHSGDTKIASASITIKAEIKIPQLVQQSIDWITSHLTSTKIESNTGYRSAATNTGDQSAATNTGYRSAATNTGYRSAATNTGNQSAATNTGYRSAATNTGDWSAATNTGDRSAATNTGYRSAATNTGNQSAATNTGDQSAATNTGDQSAATNTGYRSAATNTGDRSAATVEGKHSVAISTGVYGKAKACQGSAIVLVNRNNEGEIVHIRCAIAGKDIEADVFYMLNDDGDFVKEGD